jgi:hypothetical protein
LGTGEVPIIFSHALIAAERRIANDATPPSRSQPGFFRSAFFMRSQT